MDRKSHWETVYERKSPLEVSRYQREPLLSLQLIEAAGIAKDKPLIDVGGGASVLVDRLLERGFSRVAVPDIAARALTHAKERLGDKADAKVAMAFSGDSSAGAAVSRVWVQPLFVY